MIRLALYSALSDRAQLERVALIDNFDAWTTPKTKGATTLLETLGLEGKILVVLTRDDDKALRSFRNLANVKTIDAGELNAYDVLDCDWLLFTDATLPTAKETL
jgi:large subunit ribosomal protein L4